MEVAGFVFGVVGAVGIIGQIFDGCMKGYRVFSTAKNLGRDSERLVCKIRIEETRLMIWGNGWGVTEGKFEAHLSEGLQGHPGLRELAEEVLRQLLQTIMDCNKLQERYGFREERPGSVDKEAYQKLKDSADSRSFSGLNLREGVKLRAKWVIADKEKFDRFLDDLQYFNDRLEKLFPATRADALQLTWTNKLLDDAKRNMFDLETLESAAIEQYPKLHALANLKQLRINLDQRDAAPSKKLLSTSELKVPRWRIELLSEDSDVKRRIRGIYKKPTDDLRGSSVSENVPVLVDWIDFDPQLDLDARLHLSQRVDNLARMLHSCSARHPDLHTLDCIGYTEDFANNRYGVLHLQPRRILDSLSLDASMPPHQTLATLIKETSSGEKKTPDLDVRFKLARTLAVALWSFHSLDWLHKSFCPSNIIFFSTSAPQDEKHELDSPSIVGFDSSRPEGLAEMTAPSTLLNGEEIYRHPDSLGVWRQTYRKSFDIYSLGLLLLEIGLWKSIQGVYKPKYTPAIFSEKVIQGLVPGLGSRTGALYREIVRRCLTYDDAQKDQDGGSPHEFMAWVVLSLETLKV